MSPETANVVGITSTWNRPEELRTLLESLSQSSHPLRACVVINNGNDPRTKSVCEQAPSPLRVTCLAEEKNLGCGGGLRKGEEFALTHFPEATHLWILDDDAVVYPETLATLLSAMSAHEAEVAHPMTLDSEGHVSWAPGLLPAESRDFLRKPRSPEEYLRQCGAEPVPFSWSQGIALLVTRRTLEKLGCHRADYLVRGEDLEFSLRITQHARGIYVPAARVRHLPPHGASGDERAKHLYLLQNVAYTGLHLPHGRRIAQTVPGLWWRFHRAWSWTPRAIADSLRAVYRGALRGQPAGAS